MYKHEPLYGRITKQEIKKFLPENPVILEAGAHKGNDTIKMLKVWPTAHIYCFEPVPNIYQQLTEKVKDLSNVLCYNIALSDNNGIATMHVSSEKCDAVSSLLEPLDFLDERPEVTFSKLEVPTITLDNWAQENNVTHIDFMWLDMQGHEMAMLKASEQVLKTVKVIHTEINLNCRYKNLPLYPEFKAWLESKGFYLYKEDMFAKNWGNGLFIRE